MLVCLVVRSSLHPGEHVSTKNKVGEAFINILKLKVSKDGNFLLRVLLQENAMELQMSKSLILIRDDVRRKVVVIIFWEVVLTIFYLLRV